MVSGESARQPPEIKSTFSPVSMGQSTLLHFVTAVDLLRSTAPEYPSEAKRLGVEGTVVLTATIGIDGSVHKVELVSGNSILARAASQSVRNWQYRPASVNGKPVEGKAKIVLNFSLRNQS